MKRQFTRRRMAILALLLLLLWLLWPDSNLARVEKLRAELANQELTREERDQKSRELRAAMSKLSPTQRASLSNRGQQRIQEQLTRYSQMKPAEKTAYLDEQINREQQMLQQMQQKGGASKGGSGAGGLSGGGFSAKGPRSDEDREKSRQRRLDSTSPEFRAQMDQYRKDMAARRQQRGLGPSPFSGR